MPFYNAKNNWSNFLISFYDTPKDHFGEFAKGYLITAANLAEQLLSKNHIADNQAYPIVFLYRHSFELYLKHIIYSTILLSTLKGLSNIDLNLYNTHRLKDLAEKASRILKTLFPTDNEVVTIADEIITIAKEFDEIDPDSYSYRYPIDRNGNHSTQRNQIVNLESFSATLNKLLGNLSTIKFGISMETFIEANKEIIQEILVSLEKE